MSYVFLFIGLALMIFWMIDYTLVRIFDKKAPDLFTKYTGWLGIVFFCIGLFMITH